LPLMASKMPPNTHKLFIFKPLTTDAG